MRARIIAYLGRLADLDALRNRMAESLGESGIVTNRHPGSDEQHIEISQDVALRIIELLDAIEEIDELLANLSIG